MNGSYYTYGENGAGPHVVASIGGASYLYDDNGNMLTRGSDNLTWDAENRPVSVSHNGTITTFVYDGDGNRVKKVENGQEIIYVNKYFEKNLTSGNVTSYYYLGDRLVAKKTNTELNYIHQDHLSGTALVTSDNGSVIESLKYYSFGSTRELTGTDVTDKLFTGQRLDGTGLYYYGARYYDPMIGRFISPDPFMLKLSYAQGLNRYSYAFNNPLRYTDPTGNWPPWDQIKDAAGKLIDEVKDGLQVAQNKVVEIQQSTVQQYEEIKQQTIQSYQIVKQEVVQTYGEVKQVDEPVLHNVEKTIMNLPGNIASAAGVGGISYSIVQNVPVIDVRESSALDKAIFFTDTTVTLYPFGIFTNRPMSPPTEKEEGYHWEDQKSSGFLLPFWYAGYIAEYCIGLALYADSYKAHNAISFEQSAMGYAGTANPPSISDYWWNNR